MPIDIKDLEIRGKDYDKIVKIRRPLKPKIVKSAETVSEKFVRASDPASITDAANLNFGDGLSSEELDSLHGENFPDSIRTSNWDGFNVLKLVEILSVVSENLSGLTMYPYQKAFQNRLFYSLLVGDGATLTGLFSRQSGKSATVRTSIPALCVCLPLFAEIFPEQLGHFRNGVYVGIFAPSGSQADIIYKGVQDIAHSARAKKFYETETETGVEKSGCQWKNGSRVMKASAAPRANIEGQSCHLMILDESQDIEDEVYGMKIRPMGAFYNAVNVFIGMVGEKPGFFYNTITRNKMADNRNEYPTHFEYDYTEVIKYNPRYKAYVEADLRDYGYNSDYFQRNYVLRWKFSDGMAITEADLKHYTMYMPVPIIHATDEPVVVGIDIASEINSSVVTVGKLNRTKFVHEDGERLQTRVQVCNWLELEKIPHPQQRPTIYNFLQSYKNILWITVDTTGVGKAAFEEMQSEWDFPNMDGVTFSAEKKHELANLFYEYFWKYQILFPNTEEARMDIHWKHNFLQWVNLQRVAKKGKLVFEKAPKKNARDDYPDSLCLLLHAAKNAEKYLTDIEVSENYNLFGNKARNMSQAGFQDLREAFRNGTYGINGNIREFRTRKLLKGFLT